MQIQKDKLFASLKKSFMFGLSSGCLLGCMLGVYDAFQYISKTGYTGKSIVQNLTRSMSLSLLSMGG